MQRKHKKNLCPRQCAYVTSRVRKKAHRRKKMDECFLVHLGQGLSLSWFVPWSVSAPKLPRSKPEVKYYNNKEAASQIQIRGGFWFTACQSTIDRLVRGAHLLLTLRRWTTQGESLWAILFRLIGLVGSNANNVFSSFASSVQ